MEITFPKRPYRTHGGAHVPHHKNTAHMETRVMPPPAEVTLPMTQHIGAPCVPIVKKGDHVYVGTKVADSDAYVSAPIHASVSGTVKEIAKVMMPGGQMAEAVVITSDGLMERDPAIAPPPEIRTKQQLAQAAREKGGGTAGIDISKFAVRAAAGRYKGIDFAVASLFHIPCAAESADVLTDVFAPIVPAEFRRVLKPGGVMILAVPGARHLYGMKEVLYAAPYENEERDTDYEGFAFLGSESVRREITVEGAENIEALFFMTPYYWKTDVAGGERLRRLDTLQTEIKFRFLVYRRL